MAISGTKRWVRVAAVLALSGQLAGAAAFAAPSTPPMLEKVPADAVFYAGWEGASPAYATSKLAGFVQAAQLEKLLDETIPAMLKANEIPVNVEIYRDVVTLLKELPRHRVAVFIVPPESLKGMKEVPQVVLMAEGAETLEPMMAKVAKWIATADEGGEMAGEVAKHWGRDGQVVWIGTHKPDTAARGNFKGGALSGSAKYAKASAGMQAGTAATMYLDMGSLMKLAGSQESLIEMVLGGLGLAGVESVYGTDSYDEKGEFSTNVRVAIPGERKGLVKRLLEPASPADSTELLKWVPGDAVGFTLVKADPNGWIDALVESLQPWVPETRSSEIRVMSFLSLMTGVHPKLDLFGSLGKGWVIYQPADPEVEFVVVNRPLKPDLAKRSVDKVMGAAVRFIQAQQAKATNGQAAGQAPKGAGVQATATQVTETIDGVSVTSVEMEQTTGGMAGFPGIVRTVKVSWGMKDGTLAFASTAKGVVAALKMPGDGGIGGSAKLKAAEARLGVAPGSLMSWQDLGRLYPVKRKAAEAQIATFQPLVKGMDLTQLLPAEAAMKPLLTEMASASWTDAEGWHYRAYTPFPGADPSGFATAGAGVAGVGVGILVPSLNRARETANRVKCASNLRQIGQACLLHSNENKGRMPGSIEEILKQDISWKVFMCPSGKGGEPPAEVLADKAKLGAWLEEHGDVAYCAKGQTNQMAPDAIAAYEKAGAHDGQGRNVLFGDGRVEFYTESGFSQAYQQGGPESEVFKMTLRKGK